MPDTLLGTKYTPGTNQTKIPASASMAGETHFTNCLCSDVLPPNMGSVLGVWLQDSGALILLKSEGVLNPV